MTRLLLLGHGWVGRAVGSAAQQHRSIEKLTTIDPPFDPLLAGCDTAASGHLRSLIESDRIDSVINACGRVTGSPTEMQDANHSFVEWLCDTVAGAGIRLVHIGSASEYGDPGSPAPVSEQNPAAPTGPYATSKAAGTQAVLNARSGGLDATVARVFNIVGHPIPPSSPIHQWLADLRALGPGGGEVVVWWPSTTRDFALIEDVARALIELALADSGPPLVNVCSGVPLRYDDIVMALVGSLDIAATIRSLERPGIESVVGDPTLLRECIGWSPAMTAEILAQRATGQDG